MAVKGRIRNWRDDNAFEHFPHAAISRRRGKGDCSGDCGWAVCAKQTKERSTRIPAIETRVETPSAPSYKRHKRFRASILHWSRQIVVNGPDHNELLKSPRDNPALVSPALAHSCQARHSIARVQTL